MRATNSKPEQLCCVSIDYQDFLMPAAVGMKVVELMQKAVSTERRFGGGRQYSPGDQPVLRLELVKPAEVQWDTADQVKTTRSTKLLSGS